MFVLHFGKNCHCIQVSLFHIVFFCLHAPQLIVQSSVKNAWRRKHILNTNSYSISSRGKQLFKKICLYKNTRENLPSFLSCIGYNSLTKIAKSFVFTSPLMRTAKLVAPSRYVKWRNQPNIPL